MCEWGGGPVGVSAKEAEEALKRLSTLHFELHPAFAFARRDVDSGCTFTTGEVGADGDDYSSYSSWTTLTDTWKVLCNVVWLEIKTIKATDFLAIVAVVGAASAIIQEYLQ